LSWLANSRDAMAAKKYFGSQKERNKKCPANRAFH
jgi:hypothetical protein